MPIHLKKQKLQHQLRLLKTNKKWEKIHTFHLWNQSFHRLRNKCKQLHWSNLQLLQVPLLSSRSVASMTQIFASSSPLQRIPTKTTSQFECVLLLQCIQCRRCRCGVLWGEERIDPTCNRLDDSFFPPWDSTRDFNVPVHLASVTAPRTRSFNARQQQPKRYTSRSTSQSVPCFQEHLNKDSKAAVPWTAKYKQVKKKFNMSASSGGTSEEKKKLKSKSRRVQK